MRIFLNVFDLKFCIGRLMGTLLVCFVGIVGMKSLGNYLKYCFWNKKIKRGNYCLLFIVIFGFNCFILKMRLFVIFCLENM